MKPAHLTISFPMSAGKQLRHDLPPGFVSVKAAFQTDE